MILIVEIKDIKSDFNRYFTQKNAEITWLEKPILISKEGIDQNINIDDPSLKIKSK